MTFPVYKSYGTENSGAGDVTYALPTNNVNQPTPPGGSGRAWAVGDLLVLVIETASENVSAPAGWQFLQTVSIGAAAGTDSTALWVFFKVAVTGETAPTVTAPGDHQCGHTIAIAGADGGNPFGQIASVTTGSAGVNVSAPAVTTTHDESMILMLSSAPLSDVTWQGDLNWTNANLTLQQSLLGFNTTAGNGGQFMGEAGYKTLAGDTGISTATWSVSVNTTTAMTITVNKGGPHRRGSTAPVVNTSTTSPSSTAIGDLVIVVTWERATTTIPTHTAAAGYREIRSHSHSDGTTNGRLSVACIAATVAGAQTYTAYTTSGTAANCWTACYVLKVGTYLIDSIISASVTLTTSGLPNPPSVGPMTGDWMVMAIGAWHLGSSLTTTVTAPTFYTLEWNIAGAATSELALAVLTYTNLTAFTEDPGTFGDNQTPNGSCCITIGIRGRGPTPPSDNNGEMGGGFFGF